MAHAATARVPGLRDTGEGRANGGGGDSGGGGGGGVDDRWAGGVGGGIDRLDAFSRGAGVADAPVGGRPGGLVAAANVAARALVAAHVTPVKPLALAGLSGVFHEAATADAAAAAKAAKRGGAKVGAREVVSAVAAAKTWQAESAAAELAAVGGDVGGGGGPRGDRGGIRDTSRTDGDGPRQLDYSGGTGGGVQCSRLTVHLTLEIFRMTITLSPKPQAPSPKPQVPSPKLGNIVCYRRSTLYGLQVGSSLSSRDTETQTLKPCTETRNPKPETPDTDRFAPKPEPQIVHPIP